MSDHTDAVRAAILRVVPADGSSLSNPKLVKAVVKISNASEKSIRAALDALTTEGLLGKGRGGSVYIAAAANANDVTSSDVPDDTLNETSPEGDADEEDDGEGEADPDEFELTAQAGDGLPRARRKSTKNSKGRKSGPKDAQVLSYRHPDKRINNPEVGMVHPENDPDQPKTKWAYDPHIDPTLQFDSGRSRIETLIDAALASDDPDVMRDALAELKRLQEPYLNWTGRSERTSFEVDTVSLHVHERIDPASILSAIRKRIKGEKDGAAAFQPGLFDAPFENLPLRQALDFYRHEKNWSNRLIAGDSLLVMNSLIHKESMAGQVQMVYLDPPYGIKYGSNFQPFTNKRDVKDGADADLTQEPEMIKAFRDTWELGIHSYLTYLRDRLLLSRDLLRESGCVCVQIGDENVHLVRSLLDEIFGSKNFFSQISVKKTSGQTSDGIAGAIDYVIIYAREISKLKYRQIYREKELDGFGGDKYQYAMHQDGRTTRLDKVEIGKTATIRAFSIDTLVSQRPPGDFPVLFQGEEVRPKTGYWKTGTTGFQRLIRSSRVLTGGSVLMYRRYFDDFPVVGYANYWEDTSSGASQSDPKVYVVQTAPKVVERCLLMTTDPGDLVLDPTCGSGTTAFVAEKWGRRWITCDTSRVAITLAKQRLMTASFDYYALRYPYEGLKGGFIYKTVPHVTLKSIANNPEIDEIFERMNPVIDAALSTLNGALKAATPFVPGQGVRKGNKVTFSRGEVLHQWEVPFDWPEVWPEAAKAGFDAFHAARQTMQRAMDQSIAAHAEPETLYDKPEPDLNKLRITGPFTVEAVPNPTVFSFAETQPVTDANIAIARSGETSRQAIWRDELVKSGIRGRGGQMLRIAELEAIPGLRHLHASGNFTETGERVVVSFGPEHAALDQRQVELALTEAETLRPAPKFVVFCAFAFDPEAAKDIDEVKWPGVTLLKAQMNTDLLTEDLRRARSSNQSFWLMGQPDIDVRKCEDGKWEVEVNGFDYFDTKAGELVSGGKNKIAMWSLDPDYDQRSLFPHQVFFPMAGKKEGWSRLKKNIKAELDEDLMEHFHSTVSLPFDSGENKRVAVKIVDDRGIESLKIVSLDN